MPESCRDEWLLWRVWLSEQNHETFETLDRMPLDRVIAANDLLDALAAHQHDAREAARDVVR